MEFIDQLSPIAVAVAGLKRLKKYQWLYLKQFKIDIAPVYFFQTLSHYIFALCSNIRPLFTSLKQERSVVHFYDFRNILYILD